MNLFQPFRFVFVSGVVFMFPFVDFMFVVNARGDDVKRLFCVPLRTYEKQK